MMIIRNIRIGLSSVLLVLVITVAARCEVYTYTSESNFLATMSGPNMESFESFNAFPLPASDFFVMTDFTMSALPMTGGSQPVHTPALHAELGPDFTLNISATDGPAFVRYDSDAGETLRFTFNSPQRGFGVNVVDWGDWGIGSLILSDDLGNSFTVATTPRNDGNQLFFGVINTQSTFSQIDLLSQPTLNSFGIDEVYYGGNIVPEPSTLTLLAVSGLLGLLGWRWRRRR